LKNNILKSISLQAIVFSIIFALMMYSTGTGGNYDFLFSDNELQLLLFFYSPILIFVYYIFGVFVLERQNTFIKNIASVFLVTILGIILWVISFLTTDFSGITCSDCQYPRYGMFKLIYDSYILPFKLIGSIVGNIFTNSIINSDLSGKEYYVRLEVIEMIATFIPSIIILLGIYAKGKKN